MDTNDSADLKRRLSWVRFLEPLAEGELEKLARRCGRVRLGRGEELAVGPNEQAERMLILLEGRVRVCVQSPAGRELTLAVLAEGEPADATGLTARWARALRVEALKPSLVCSVERGILEQTVLRHPRAGWELCKVLAGRLALMSDRWADAVGKEVPERLAGLLLMLVEDEGVVTPAGPVLPTRYTHNQLASMIGSRREAVTRALASLQQGGGVDVRGRRVHVVDPDALRRAAGE